MGALTTAYLGGWRQERIEANKRKWAFEDAKADRLDDAICQLTVKLASAQHSMCWITWVASEAPNRITQERADAYDKEMHTIIPEFLGLWSQIASHDMEAYSMVTSIINSVEDMDVRIGRACLDIVDDQERAAKALADLYPECVTMAEELPELMAKVIRKALLKS
jgi:hypothetical protein